MRCKGCGSQAVHWKCNLHVDTFQCAECQRIEDVVTSERRRKRENRRKRKSQQKKNRKKAGEDQATLKEKNAKQSKYTGEAAEELLKKAQLDDGVVSECSSSIKGDDDDISGSGKNNVFKDIYFLFKCKWLIGLFPFL